MNSCTDTFWKVTGAAVEDLDAVLGALVDAGRADGYYLMVKEGRPIDHTVGSPHLYVERDQAIAIAYLLDHPELLAEVQRLRELNTILLLFATHIGNHRSRNLHGFFFKEVQAARTVVALAGGELLDLGHYRAGSARWEDWTEYEKMKEERRRKSKPSPYPDGGSHVWKHLQEAISKAIQYEAHGAPKDL